MRRTNEPAPGWFQQALALQPQRQYVMVDAARIEVLVWGPSGAPGIIFVHGSNAHADWWSHMAPLFAADRRVLALSLSGMGRSSWRDSYSHSLYSREILAVAQSAALYGGSAKPLLVGHSFGGFQIAHTLAHHGSYFGGGIIIDTALQAHASAPADLRRRSANRVMGSLEDAVARFRLAPPQGVENTYILDYIARHSVRETDQGVTWCFDPFIFNNFAGEEVERLLTGIPVPLAFIRGERSQVVDGRAIETARRLYGRWIPEVVIPDSDHHVMVDQPLALAATLRALLSVWTQLRF